ncbi:MAG: SCP2 domain-containing protein [Lonepinella koalarum]|nr:SCP2 domain-containing protein [Lonepinella koalarum]
MSMTFMLPQLVNASLETALNGLISRSQGISPILRRLNGKILAVNLSRFQQQLFLVFSLQRVDILQHYEGEADCSVEISPNLLLKFPKKSDLSQYINDKSIILQGDLQVLQDFAGLMEQLEKDPAELLSPYLGDVASQSAVNFARVLLGGLKQHSQTSGRYWSERLTEEYQLVAPALAIAHFCDEVKILEKQTALLAKKISYLQQQYE